VCCWWIKKTVRLLVDALGNGLHFLLTGGQRHDITQADALLASLDFARIIADRCYDSDDFLHTVAASGAEVVIPARKSRPCDAVSLF